MFEIIISLLMAMGIISSPSQNTKPIVVIDQNSGISYGIGTANGSGGSVVPNADYYFLVKDPNGRYRLVKK